MNPSLERFRDHLHTHWSPLSSALVATCQQALETLARAPTQEPWLAHLRAAQPEHQTLVHDPEHGFLLLAHTEAEGRYRPPHDHGRSWGLYAVAQGAVEMATFARVVDDAGQVRLVQRDLTRLEAGQVKVFLPGDIHDTRCVQGPALLLRFTERDLGVEDREHHRVARYVQRDGTWTL